MFYGSLIDNPDPSALSAGYIVSAIVMIIGGAVAYFLAVDAENKALEEVATPLSVVAAKTATPTNPPPPSSARADHRTDEGLRPALGDQRQGTPNAGDDQA